MRKIFLSLVLCFGFVGSANAGIIEKYSPLLQGHSSLEKICNSEEASDICFGYVYGFIWSFQYGRYDVEPDNQSCDFVANAPYCLGFHFGNQFGRNIGNVEFNRGGDCYYFQDEIYGGYKPSEIAKVLVESHLTTDVMAKNRFRKGMDHYILIKTLQDYFPCLSEQDKQHKIVLNRSIAVSKLFFKDGHAFDTPATPNLANIENNDFPLHILTSDERMYYCSRSLVKLEKCKNYYKYFVIGLNEGLKSKDVRPDSELMKTECVNDITRENSCFDLLYGYEHGITFSYSAADYFKAEPINLNGADWDDVVLLMKPYLENKDFLLPYLKQAKYNKFKLKEDEYSGIGRTDAHRLVTYLVLKKIEKEMSDK